MRSFRKILVSLCISAALVLSVNQITCYLYESAKDNLVLMKADLHSSKGTVETLFLGTSLMDQGMDVGVVSENLGTTSFNLGSSAQPLGGSFYLLQDQYRHNPIRQVFLGLSVKSLISDSDAKNTSAKLRVSAQMFSPLIKLRYILNVAEPREYEQFLFYPARVENIFDFDKIRQNISYKQSEDFQNRISHKNATYTYYGMGFQSSDKIYQPTSAQKKRVDKSIFWDRENLVQENIAYLEKIINFCREKNLELNLVIFPHSRYTAKNQGDLADMDAYLEELCHKEKISLFNYNYTACPEIYEILTDDCFQDGKHLNRKGAAEFAALLCRDYQNRMEK